MEPRSTACAVFLIPELVLLVSAYLSSSDVAQCIRVCKDWSRQFETHLWTNFCPSVYFIDSLSFSPHMNAALSENSRHIRTFRPAYIEETLLQVLARGLLQQQDDTTEDPSTLCTNLWRIDLKQLIGEDYTPVPWHSHIVTLLCHNQRLTCVTVPLELLQIDVSTTAIAQLRHLRHLAIFSLDNEGTSREILLILEACLPLPELTKLHFFEMRVTWFQGDTTPDGSGPEAIIEEATITRFSHNSSAKKIKSLRLPSNGLGSFNPLPLLLLKSDLLDLDTCEIPGFSQDEDIREIELIVRERCPRLKHLRCPCFKYERQDGRAARAFIRGCTALQSFTSHMFSDYDAESIGEEGFYDDRDEFEPRLIISELLYRHDSTLEAVLSRCKKLTRFWVMCDSSGNSMGAITSTHISLSDWVCMELRELGLTLNLRPKDSELYLRMNRKEIADWSEDDHDAHVAYQQSMAITTKRVYTQIGRLEQLEELALQIDRSHETCQSESDYACNLTLYKGWLGEMAGLKNLKRLRIKADFWSAMGQAEVEFILEHWPLLNEIAFGCDLAHIYAAPHWQWLRIKRPQLCFASETQP
ncbi:hypothetical protein BGZ70_006001 [Mortierella alpina]|uniref:F-box domain-containing protein n=1 Tax=Mortierella alpina TaxID=64518 RepID=A0A9P6M3Y1_MORAP|nr:hypothetical protein BGZ70_006001 [Mortierella alpina]